MVELSGRVGVNAYSNLQGEAKASLTFHVNSIKFHGSAKSTQETFVTGEPVSNSISANEIKELSEDLPF